MIMKRLLLIAFAGFMLSACTSLTMLAEKRVQPLAPDSNVGVLLRDLNHLGPQILRETFDQTLGVVQNYIEIEHGHRQNLQDSGDGDYLALRLYPKGKSKSTEHYTAEAWFRFSGKSDNGISLDFQHSPSLNQPLRPEDYL